MNTVREMHSMFYSSRSVLKEFRRAVAYGRRALRLIAGSGSRTSSWGLPSTPPAACAYDRSSFTIRPKGCHTGYPFLRTWRTRVVGMGVWSGGARKSTSQIAPVARYGWFCEAAWSMIQWGYDVKTDAPGYFTMGLTPRAARYSLAAGVL